MADPQTYEIHGEDNGRRGGLGSQMSWRGFERLLRRQGLLQDNEELRSVEASENGLHYYIQDKDEP